MIELCRHGPMKLIMGMMIELSHSLCTHVCSTQCSQTANYAGPLYVYREAMDMSTSRNTMNMGRFITYLTILTKAMGRSITHNRKTMGKSITQLWTNPLHILENLLEGQMLITITMGRSSSHSRNHWQVHYPKKCRGRPITPHRKNMGMSSQKKQL